ncbi:MAG: Clp protease/crotonase-like domain-containing protein [Gammaproteobacteria bacterium]
MSERIVNVRGLSLRWVMALLLLLSMQVGAADSALLLDIKGAIGPAAGDYVHRGLERARVQQSPLVILRLDTPGELDAAMRDIIHDILAAPQPVVSFVAPGGARAASAGTYILLFFTPVMLPSWRPAPIWARRRRCGSAVCQAQENHRWRRRRKPRTKIRMQTSPRTAAMPCSTR